VFNKSQENELLICIARRELTNLREPLDWDYVFSAAQAHGLLPLLQKDLANS